MYSESYIEVYLMGLSVFRFLFFPVIRACNVAALYNHCSTHSCISSIIVPLNKLQYNNTFLLHRCLLVPHNVGVSASGELVWNQTDATYTFKAKWTVPRIYNLPETLVYFVFARLLPLRLFKEDKKFKQNVTAVSHRCHACKPHAFKSVTAYSCACKHVLQYMYSTCHQM